MAQYQDLLAVARRAAAAAAGLIRASPRPDPADWDRKAPADFATAVDRRAEALIAEILREAVPDSIVVGEELSPEAGTAPVRWIVDPLDGTTNFLHGYPAYAVSIGVEVEGLLAAGVVADVARDRVYAATARGGARCGPSRLAVSRIAEPRDALLGTGFPFKAPASERMDAYAEQLKALLGGTSGVRRAGSAALDLAHVAEGLLDGFWELWLAPWDIAAGTLLVREAGGVVTGLDGGPVDPAGGGIVAGNPRIHAWMLEQLDR